MWSRPLSIAKATGGQRQVHLVWTREDDIRGGYYRPMVYRKSVPGSTRTAGLVPGITTSSRSRYGGHAVRGLSRCEPGSI